MLDVVPRLLNYGLIGLAAFFGYLSYRLIARSKSTSSGQVPVIVFMLFAIVLAGIGAVLEYTKLKRPSEHAWGKLQGPVAMASFVAGGQAKRLHGSWTAVWHQTNEDNSEGRYTVKKDGETIEYPPETMEISTYGSAVSCKTQYSTGEPFEYWYEGRISSNGHVTLVYWTPPEGPGSGLAGVVFLALREDLDGPPRLEGWWRGFTRNGAVTHGRTEWTKQ